MSWPISLRTLSSALTVTEFCDELTVTRRLTDVPAVLWSPWPPNAIRRCAELGRAADPEVLDHHVGLLRQRAHQSLAARRAEVDGYRLLAAVGAQEIGALAAAVGVRPIEERRPPATRIVAAAGALDLDYIGAKVGQQLTRPGAGENSTQIENPESRQWPCH